MKKRNKLSLIGILSVLIVTTSASAQEIFQAIRSGDLAKVKMLVESNPRLVDEKNNRKNTPLHVAAQTGRADIVGFLLEKGAAADSRDEMGITPLMNTAWAADGLEAAKKLIAQGADVNAENKFQFSTLGWAASAGNRALVDYLLEYGAKFPSPNHPKARVVLKSAAQHGLTRLLNMMIAAGVDFRERGQDGTTLLHDAAAGGSIEAVVDLLKAGLRVSEADADGWTPLHHAADNGRRDAAAALLDRGAAIDARTIDGHSAYNLAVEMGHQDVVDLLIARKADRGPSRFPALTGPYFGQKAPGKLLQPFAAGIVAARYNFHGNVVFSPDGNWALWSVFGYGREKASAIIESRMKNGYWTPPALAAFSAVGNGDDVPCFSPDGRKLYFISQRPLTKGGKPDKENIWVVERAGDGWSEPRPLPPVINDTPGIHWQISVDAKDDLYFMVRGGNGFGGEDLYWSKFENGTYRQPANLGPAINGPGQEGFPFIAPDGSYLLFAKSDVPGAASLHISFRKLDGSWTPAKNLNDIIQSACGSPNVTRDGRYLFVLGAIGEIDKPFWMEAGFIESLRKAIMESEMLIEGLQPKKSRSEK